MVKLIGALLILVSGSSIGWIIGGLYLNRVKELKELQLAFNILNTEISYGRTLLADALKRTSEVLTPPLSNIFFSAAEELNNTRGKMFSELWKNILENYSKNFFLNKEDLEILINWGRQIGVSTLENQLNINKLTIKRLEIHEEMARDIASRRVKCVRYAGVLISLMVIILFY